LSKYNFPCLLNLPEVLAEFGPIRNLWEGGYQGEGYLRKTKPRLANGLKKNWQVITARGMLQSTSLDVLVEERCPEISSNKERTRSFELDSNVLENVGEEGIQHYGLLLPLLSTDGNGSFSRSSVYSLVESEWNEMLEDGTIGLQKVVPPID
jgi:hypothetical protein